MHISIADLHSMLPNMQLYEWQDSLQFARYTVMQLLRQRFNDHEVASHAVLQLTENPAQHDMAKH